MERHRWSVCVEQLALQDVHRQQMAQQIPVHASGRLLLAQHQRLFLTAVLPCTIDQVRIFRNLTVKSCAASSSATVNGCQMRPCYMVNLPWPLCPNPAYERMNGRLRGKSATIAKPGMR